MDNLGAFLDEFRSNFRTEITWSFKELRSAVDNLELQEKLDKLAEQMKHAYDEAEFHERQVKKQREKYNEIGSERANLMRKKQLNFVYLELKTLFELLGIDNKTHRTDFLAFLRNVMIIEEQEDFCKTIEDLYDSEKEKQNDE